MGKVNRNMAGLSEEEAALYAGRHGWGCLVAGACAVAVALLGGGWLAYLACCRWQRLEDLAVLGWFPAAGALWIAVKALVKGV